MAHIGHYISGAGHVGLIGFVLVGPLFSSDPLPFETVSVSVISAQDFAALTQQPRPVALPDAPAPPAVPLEQNPDLSPVVDAPPEESPPPEPPAAPPPAAAVPVPPPPPARVEPPQTETPQLVTPEAIEVPQAPDLSQRPQQRPSERVAPVPVAPPEPDTTIAQETQPAITPEPSETALQERAEPQEATAPEEAASAIVTEAEESQVSAPEQTIRPRPRPQELAAAPPLDAPSVAAAPETPAAPAPETASAIENALQEALLAPDPDAAPAAPPPAGASGGPAGPPLTAGEREGLVLAVQNCWIIDPGSPAAEVVVTIGMGLAPDGRVEGEIRRVSATGGDARAQEVAFQAARRAVLRCQGAGFPLPPEKYDQWQEVEMTFNPENMRVR